MATDQGPVVRSALLRGELIRLRKERGQTQEPAAAELIWSQSKLIWMESGRGPTAAIGRAVPVRKADRVLVCRSARPVEIHRRFSRDNLRITNTAFAGI
jgi:hypothetical protein